MKKIQWKRKLMAGVTDMKKWILNGIVIAIFLLVLIQGVYAEETVVKPVVVVLDMDSTANMGQNYDSNGLVWLG